MKCYTRIKYMLISLSFVITGLLIFAKIDDASFFTGNDFARGFSEGFISSALVALGLLSIKAVFFSKNNSGSNGDEIEDRTKLLWMVGAASFVGYFTIDAISSQGIGDNIFAVILLIQSLIYYGLYAGKFAKRRYQLK